MKKIISLLIFSLVSATSINTFAQTSSNLTTTTKASATLAGSCLLSVPNVVFGTYYANQPSATTATQNILIQCTKGTNYTFNETRVSNGLASWAGANNESVVEMSNNNGNGDVLMIQVYNPVSSAWVDDINFLGGGVNAIKGTADGTNQAINLNFRILPNQYSSPGNYTATYTATVSY